MVLHYTWIYLKAGGNGLDLRVQVFLWTTYFSFSPKFIRFPLEGRYCLWCPSGCERVERKSCWAEWSRDILAHLSSPLRLQNGGLVNLAALLLKWRKITLAVNIYKAGYLHRKLNFCIFLEKPWSWLHGACIPSWHRAAGAEQLLHVLSGALALQWSQCDHCVLYWTQSALLLYITHLGASQYVIYGRSPGERGTFRDLQIHSQNHQHHILETVRTWHMLIELMWFWIFELEKVTPRGTLELHGNSDLIV